MANTKSAAKRVLVIKKKTLRNNMKKSALRTSIKKCREAIAANSESAQDILKDTIKAIDKAASKNILHKNTAARRKSQLVRAFNAAAGK
ncbi:MAG: 30S ribosomal protein S20 [Clostridiaceae bacterium]|nr:30S ribosomal protein S20 [Clostridiaceae bacterium]